MKLAIVLLCVVAVVQGRSTAVKVVNSERSVAALGEHPWVVHLRLAVSTSGFLDSCVGSLIDPSWVLTTAYCVRQVTFVWVRLGAIETIRPQLALETTNVIRNSDWNQLTNENNVALINLNRVVELTPYIGVVALPAASSQVPLIANFCAYGSASAEQDGEWLSCRLVSSVVDTPQTVIYEAEDLHVSPGDTGAPVVADGVLIGVLSDAGDFREEASFIRASNQVNWISGMTGIGFNRAAAQQREEVVIVNEVN